MEVLYFPIGRGSRPSGWSGTDTTLFKSVLFSYTISMLVIGEENLTKHRDTIEKRFELVILIDYYGLIHLFSHREVDT